MAISPVSAATSPSAFGLDFQSMLRIILTQLTYQDPLKPLDNFQFVSQLGQFAQLQQSQSQTEQFTALLSAQAASQATSMLGRTIDFQNGAALVSGVVQSVSFGATGEPGLTIKTPDGQSLANISLANVTQIR